MEKLQVYNPADESDAAVFRFSAHEFPLAPNAVNEIVSPWPEVSAEVLLEKCLTDLAYLGVRRYYEDADDPSVAKGIIESAEAAHTEFLRKKHEPTLREHAELVRAAEASGASYVETDRVKTAKAKLVKRGVLAAIAFLAILLSPAAARAQVGPETRPAFSHYDLSSGALIYCALEPNIVTSDASNARIQTAGSNATVTAVSGAPFTNVNQWAELYISTPIGNFVRTVTARASATSITVDTALDISAGASFTYRNLFCGTTANDGWMKVSLLVPFSLTYVIEQINAASIDMRFECTEALATATTNPIYPGSDDAVGAAGCGAGTVAAGQLCNFTTTAILTLDVYRKWDRCRMGMKINGDAGVQKITGYLSGTR